MLESAFQKRLIKRIKSAFPNAMVLKNDPTSLQGIPDLLVLVGSRWAMLEVKATPTSSVRPNQPHYVERLNQMAFAAFVDPTTIDKVMEALVVWFNGGDNAVSSAPSS